jgi:uncharacterized repeat protein (TIGR02543 family)
VDLKTGGEYRIDGCTFTDIGFANGGALTGGGHVTVTNSLFEKNRTRGIMAGQASSYTIEKSSFVDNSGTVTDTYQAGGIFLRGGSSEANATSHTITDCYFKDNVMTGAGGSIRGAAIDCVSGYCTVEVTSSVFEGNKVVGTAAGHSQNNRIDGGAIYVACLTGKTSFNVTDSVFDGNFAQDDGGAIGVEGAINTTRIYNSIRNCTFTGNTIAGAQYGKSGVPIFGSAWVTDGSGGAVSYYGITESDITHCTFYKNGITGALVGGGSNFGAVGGGGAVGVETADFVTSPKDLPPCPELSNNIFVANYVKKPASQAMITLINSVTGNALGNIEERSKTGNVFVLPSTDRDIQGIDPRGLANNGNVGYDNKNAAYDNNGVAENGVKDGAGTLINIPITPETVFAYTTGSGADAVPKKEFFGASVGTAGQTAQRFCYIPSPLTDEMYRDGSGPYYTANVRKDTRGYTRDHYPNAGAAEIYWTKFDPGIADGGEWIASKVDFDQLGGIASKLQPEVYYLVTNPSPDNKLTTFPRSTFELGDKVHNQNPADWYADYGFSHWESDQPVTPGGMDHEKVQPSNVVTSTKQTYTAIWKKALFRVDFDLMYDDGGTHMWGKPLLDVPKNTTILAPAAPQRDGYEFDGWYKEDTLTTPWNFASDRVNEDTVLHAKWTPVTPAGAYKVHHYLVSNARGTVLDATESRSGAVGTTVTATVKSYEGYTHNPKHADAKPSGVIAADGSLALKAFYEIKTFTVTFKDGDGTALKTQTVEYGENAAAPKNPARNGYTFTGWDKPQSSWENVKADVTVTAKYSKDNEGGGIVTPGKTPPKPDGPNTPAGGGSVVTPGKTPPKPGKPPGNMTRPRTPLTPNPGTPLAPKAENSPGKVTPVPKDAPGNGPAPGEDKPVQKTIPQEDYWALLNLILAIAGAASVLAAIIIALVRRRDENKDGNKFVFSTGKIILICIAVVMAAGGIVFFLLTEDLTLSLEIVDMETIPQAVIFLVAFVAAVLIPRRNDDDGDNDELETYTYTKI